MKLIKTLAAAAFAMGIISGSALADAHGGKKDIVDTAVEAGSFTTLVAAVQAADLVETLKGDGPFTVFAPTDDAFAALGMTVQDLLKPENKDKLTAVLTYHVIGGTVMAADLVDDSTPATVQGSNVTIDLDNGPMVNDANVVTADVVASNGVIHVIDKVLVPEGVL